MWSHLKQEKQSKHALAGKYTPWLLVGNEGMRYLRVYIGYLIPSFPTKSQGVYHAGGGGEGVGCRDV